MPEPLTAAERAAIRQWIRQDPHWPEQHTMVLLDRFEATVQQYEALEAAARSFIADSEEQGGPPPETCNACYWNLRSAVAALPGKPAG